MFKNLNDFADYMDDNFQDKKIYYDFDFLGRKVKFGKDKKNSRTFNEHELNDDATIDYLKSLWEMHHRVIF